MRYFFILFLFISCSTQTEKDISLRVKGGGTDISFGKIYQTLSLLRFYYEKSDLTERAGYVVLAHAISTFYGYPYDETRYGEEKFIRAQCTRMGFKVKTVHECVGKLSRDIVTQSQGFLKTYSGVQRLKKNSGDLKKEFLDILEIRMSEPHEPIRAGLFEGERFNFSSLSGKLFYRIPDGSIMILDHGRITVGNMEKLPMESFHVTETLSRASNLEEGAMLTLILRKSEDFENIIKLLEISAASSVRKMVIWGTDGNSSAGLKINIGVISPGILCSKSGICSTSNGKSVDVKKFRTFEDAVKTAVKVNNDYPEILVSIKKEKKSDIDLPELEELLNNKPANLDIKKF
ncbi:MAG: hypothetical protein JXR95_01535 [Deltaproteobacteria bacterium]|nr:hypothetical protein [Deltaproteobacteria bacterium]